MYNVIGFSVPVPAIIVALVEEDYKYTLGGFPPFICVSKSSDLWFYSANLVIDVLLAVASSLLIIVFWKVHKVTCREVISIVLLLCQESLPL